MADSLSQYLNALGTIESSNNYSALGPLTEKGNRAYGRYQVMDFNIPSWTEAATGQAMTPEQFLANPEAQDAVARHRFGSYVEQYGNPYDAASMWFSGRPMAKAGDSSDVTGTTVPEYVGRFANALGMSPEEMDTSGIKGIDQELLALQREKLALRDSDSYERKQRQRQIAALTDWYESTKPKRADFSLLPGRGD